MLWSVDVGCWIERFYQCITEFENLHAVCKHWVKSPVLPDGVVGIYVIYAWIVRLNLTAHMSDIVSQIPISIHMGIEL